MIPEYILEKVREYKRDGYAIIPCDEPARGMRGLFFMREGQFIWDDKVEDHFEYEIYIEWPIFDKPLVPEVSSVGLEMFLEFTNDPDVLPCNFPKELQFGLVKYLPEEGKSILKKMRISNIRLATSEMKDKFTESRKALLQRNESQKSYLQEIMEEISKID